MTSLLDQLPTCQCGKKMTPNGRAFAQLRADPNVFKGWQCAACRKGTGGAAAPPKVPKAKEPVAEPQPEDMQKFFTFSEDLQQFIPQSSEDYVNRYFGTGKDRKKDEEVLMWHYTSKDPLLKNVLFVGESGTGKTLLTHYFCFKNKIPHYRVVMNGGTTVEDIIGQQVMDETGKFQFVYQVLIKMMLGGGMFVVDEINAGQKDLLHVLNSITDFARKAIVTQHKGEVIKAVDNFLIVACMNPPEEYDLQEMSKSLKSRFCPYYFNFDEKIDETLLGDKALVEFAKDMRTARFNKKIDTPLNTRDLMQYKKVKEGLGYEVAKFMLLSKFENGEKDVVRTAMETRLEKSKVLGGESK